MRKFFIAASVLALGAGTAAIAHNHGGGMPMGDITRAEAQKMAEERFTKKDVNADGLLNQADRDARKAKYFDTMDTDKNGAISRDEFMAAHGDKDGKGSGHRMGGGHGKGDGHRMGGGHGGMMRHMMEMADTNKDGSVSAAESTAAHLAMFDKADANKDGTVTSQERRTAMQAMMEKAHAAQPAAPKAE